MLIAAIGVAMEHDARAAEPETPLSLGYTNAGRLVGGKPFQSTPFMRRTPAHSKSNVRYALPQLLKVLDRASRSVARKYPGSVLEIGELSRREGGRIRSHLSHQSGRDVDVSFYLVDLEGQPVRVPKFLRCDGQGDGRDDPMVRFDEKRNWAFVRALLEDSESEVRQIFIYAPLRARLLAYASKVGAPLALRAKAAAAMMQPVNALPHDDHFHIRISCPSDQVELGCADLPLWKAPGSPDEFGPELLAERPSRRDVVANAVPVSAWGPLSRLWSDERSVCQRVTAACSLESEGPVCEDLSALGVPTLATPPPDEMDAPAGVPEPAEPAIELVAAAEAPMMTMSVEPPYCGVLDELEPLQCAMPARMLALRAPAPIGAPVVLTGGPRVPTPPEPPAPDPFDRGIAERVDPTALSLECAGALPASMLEYTPDQLPNACERPVAVLSAEGSAEARAAISALQ